MGALNDLYVTDLMQIEVVPMVFHEGPCCYVAVKPLGKDEYALREDYRMHMYETNLVAVEVFFAEIYKAKNNVYVFRLKSENDADVFVQIIKDVLGGTNDG